ncbi:LOW QUALITY PROTEIN: uncharacterized protein LOC132935101 [Metopolophium dirhodum]|uniref:LOW QUALITY PROTEIN: uncharacterized protein LOC132935101 n=1 Tax=Metopolophium dirhodum TaxID=44670 RepID=UPI00298FF0E3|nr:LOW QUALITY PROTEIN: uncharacterized protein LOC132935101 [Metopolophium dirhodum]
MSEHQIILLIYKRILVYIWEWHTLMLRSKEFQNAANEFLKVLELEPENIIALRNLSATYCHLNNMVLSVEVYKKCLNLQPENFDINLELAMINLHNLKNYPETIIYLKKCIKLNPERENVNQWSSILGLDLTINSIVCERHFTPQDILHPNLLVNGLNSKLKILVPFALPVPIMNDVPESRIYCSIPGCTTNAFEDISFFTPQNEDVNQWSLSLGLDLTINSIVCERHFRPQDVLQPTVMVNGVCKKIKELIRFSLPMPMNAGLSASNATPFIQKLETNDGPVFRTIYDVMKFKRNKPDNLLCTKTIKNNVLDKSLATINKMFSSKNENKEYTAVINDTHEYNTTSDLDPTLKLNTVKPVNLSIVKIEPLDDDDFQIKLETEPELILPTLGTEQVEYDDLLPLPSIDNSLSISLKKLKNLSANSSLSITLEPIKNFKITTNNSCPSVSLLHCLPSPSSSSVYNISQQSLLQYKQKATSTLKIPDKLSSNTVISPESIDNRCILLKPISPTTKSNSSELPEIKKNNDEDFIEKDNGFIYKISKMIVLPSVFWYSIHDDSQNSTVFSQQDNLYDTVKTISFFNSILPKIQIYGKTYKYDKPIITKNELQNLIEQIDNIEKCYGFDLVIHDNCVGYYDKSTEDIISCSVCQEKLKQLHDLVESLISICFISHADMLFANSI